MSTGFVKLANFLAYNLKMKGEKGMDEVKNEPQVTVNNKGQSQVQKIDELIDRQLSHFSKRIPADLEETQALVQLLLARMLAKF